MIDYKEIGGYEIFEDLCEEILLKRGLQVRRLGRGPGQLGKDMIAKESYVGSLNRAVIRIWLVECKFTVGNRTLNERDIFNIRDRVEGQKATGYFLFTNGRLSVNLERTLSELNAKIDIITWKKDNIQDEIVGCSEIYRKYFPESWENKLVILF